MIPTIEILLDKAEIIASFKTLPDKVSAEDLIEKILFMKRLEIGLQDIAQGRVVSHEEVMEQFKEWKREKLSGLLPQEQK